MFEDYRIVIRYRSGETKSGYGPLIEMDKKVVRYASTPNHMPLTTTTSLVDATVIMLMKSGGGEARWPEGRVARARLESGEVVTGMTRPVPMPGGIWIRPESSPDDGMLVFIPEDAAAAMDFADPQGRLPPSSGIELDFRGAMKKTEQLQAFYAHSPRDGGRAVDRTRREDPHEYATVQEFSALTPAAVAQARQQIDNATIDESDKDDTNPNESPDEAPTMAMPKIRRADVEEAKASDSRGVIIRRKT